VVYGAPELGRPPTLEHGATPSGGWLREHRTKVAIWIAVAEGLLIVVGVIPRLPAIAIAILVVVGYFAFGRRLANHTARQVAWIAGASQAFVALIPALALVVGTLALIALALIAVIALVLIFGDRR
jgi:hypothetical protein